jgi:hypothetical protein
MLNRAWNLVMIGRRQAIWHATAVAFMPTLSVPCSTPKVSNVTLRGIANATDAANFKGGGDGHAGA